MTAQMLDRRQARWAKLLSGFDLKMMFGPGKSGRKPDWLTRRSGDRAKEGHKRRAHQYPTVLNPSKLAITVILAPLAEFVRELGTAYTKDRFPNSLLQILEDGVWYSWQISLADCTS